MAPRARESLRGASRRPPSSGASTETGRLTTRCQCRRWARRSKIGLPRPVPTRRVGVMAATTIWRSSALSVIDYRCDAGPGDKPFVETHDSFSVAYVRKGSFGYRSLGEAFELVAGSLLVGHPGDEYLCTHDHHDCGDECLSFH